MMTAHHYNMILFINFYINVMDFRSRDHILHHVGLDE